MKRIVSAILILIMLFAYFPLGVSAEDNLTFIFDLSVDGSDTKTVKTGEIITVVLYLRRTDSPEQYTMYAMQDEILYDSDFFELVEGSTVLAEDIASTDIGMRDNYRELYMNFLSMSDGKQWNADMLIGSFQLRVIASSGVTKICNENYLVSTPDGKDRYSCQANNVTIIVSTECVVHFESNGGSPIDDMVVQYGETISQPDNPTRDGFVFDGWYMDIDKTQPWDFDIDTVTGNMTLYAKWVSEANVESPSGNGEISVSEKLNLWWLPVVLTIPILILLLQPKCVVTFNSMGGSEVKSRRVRKNGKVPTPNTPRKKRAIFVGWYRDELCSIPWNFESDKVTENTTLYAKWN